MPPKCPLTLPLLTPLAMESECHRKTLVAPGKSRKRGRSGRLSSKPSPTLPAEWLAPPDASVFTAPGQQGLGTSGCGEASGDGLLPLSPSPIPPRARGRVVVVELTLHLEEEGTEACVLAPISTPPARFQPLEATHVKPASSPSCVWQVPPFPQGPLEQLSRDTSQSRP